MHLHKFLTALQNSYKLYPRYHAYFFNLIFLWVVAFLLGVSFLYDTDTLLSLGIAYNIRYKNSHHLSSFGILIRIKIINIKNIGISSRSVIEFRELLLLATVLLEDATFTDYSFRVKGKRKLILFFYNWGFAPFS